MALYRVTVRKEIETELEFDVLVECDNAIDAGTLAEDEDNWVQSDEKYLRPGDLISETIDIRVINVQMAERYLQGG